MITLKNLLNDQKCITQVPQIKLAMTGFRSSERKRDTVESGLSATWKTKLTEAGASPFLLRKVGLDKEDPFECHPRFSLSSSSGTSGHQCHSGRANFDNLTETVFEGQHQTLNFWMLCLHLMRVEPFQPSDEPRIRIKQ
jgi:hypothetical protein